MNYLCLNRRVRFDIRICMFTTSGRYHKHTHIDIYLCTYIRRTYNYSTDVNYALDLYTCYQLWRRCTAITRMTNSAGRCSSPCSGVPRVVSGTLHCSLGRSYRCDKITKKFTSRRMGCVCVCDKVIYRIYRLVLLPPKEEM